MSRCDLTPERWAQIEDLFHRAAECDLENRPSLLAKECAISGEPIFDHEQDAITVIEAAAKRLGGVDKVTPGDLCAPAYSPSVRHYLEKDN